MYNVKCPTYTKVYQPISDDNIPESKEWLTREQNIIKYIVANTGLNGSLSDLADVADNIQSMVSYWQNKFISRNSEMSLRSFIFIHKLNTREKM